MAGTHHESILASPGVLACIIALGVATGVVLRWLFSAPWELVVAAVLPCAAFGFISLVLNLRRGDVQ